MATIPSKPYEQFTVDAYDGLNKESGEWINPIYAVDNNMEIQAGHQKVLTITREQAMAFFDLVPRPECTCNGIGTHCDLHPQ